MKSNSRKSLLKLPYKVLEDTVDALKPYIKESLIRYSRLLIRLEVLLLIAAVISYTRYRTILVGA